MALGTYNVLGADEIFGKVKFVGANAQGPQITLELVNVMFRPTSAIGLISEEWGQLQVTGEALADDTGVFGTITHPDSALISPLTSQYYVGKGIVSVQIMAGLTPDIAYVDIGNVPVFEFEPTVETLPHFSSRYGVRAKDLEIITSKAAAVNITMDEFTARNLQLAFMAVVAPP